jgi:hypothetical protein
MSTQLTVDSPPEKATEFLLRYFKFKGNINVVHSEPSHIRLHAGGYWDSEYTSCSVEIKIRPEENKTRMTFDFHFREYFIMVLASTVLAMGLIWLVPWAGYVSIKRMIGEQPYSITYSAVFSIIWAIYCLIATTYGVGRTKRKFPDDIRKAFDVLYKTE